MATIRKLPSKRWYIEVRKHGQRKSKTFDTKLKALTWAEEMEQSLNPDGLITGKTVGDAFIKFRDEITPSRKSHRSEHNRMNKFLRDEIANIFLDEIRQHHFDEWIKRSLERIKPSSVNRDLNLLSAVFREAIRWRWIASNPIHGINRPKNPQPRDRRISDSEIEKILNALHYDGGEIRTTCDIIAVAFNFDKKLGVKMAKILCEERVVEYTKGFRYKVVELTEVLPTLHAWTPAGFFCFRLRLINFYISTLKDRAV